MLLQQKCEDTTLSNFPEISVVMSAYNDQDVLPRSIDSILAQSFKNFEFIIVNDGSTDQTGKILQKYADRHPRIRIINQANMGLTKSLNTAIAQAQGKYIARLDADDVALEHRLQKQIGFMKKDNNIILCGSSCVNIYENNDQTQWRWQSPEEIMKTIYYYSPFPHSSTMFKKESFETLNGYNETFITSQDMELWMRMAKIGKVTMLKDPLITRYVHRNSISAKKRWQQSYDALRARWMHNQNSTKLTALYYTLKSLLISLLPPSFITATKKLCAR